MFIDNAMNSTTGAPAERNVSGIVRAQVMFRSAGARSKFFGVAFYKISPLMGRRAKRSVALLS